ncbi:3-ketoacyl-ACP reductase [Nibricoccus sp. IMCC34717]|uniref:3-ketoacyl-ACP reductase n=1 Tax=Nibricoccus sp. IMCC34717 TaxID=3034021 RepID=UPI00384C84F2
MKPIALVTGGTRGIGLGIARALANEGFDLIVNGVRPEEAAADALASLRSSGATVFYAAGDLGSATGREAILNAAKRHAPAGLSLLVNNAGIAPRVRADLLEMSPESFDDVVGTNLRGTFLLTQAIARLMLEAKVANAGLRPSIVTISSISATVASTNRGEYCIAKAGLAMMTQLFAARLGADGIGVFEVRPGVIRTDMTAGVTEKYDRLISNGLCVQPRWGTPEDVGAVVAAIARNSFPYSTGQVFMVDGGLCLQRL